MRAATGRGERAVIVHCHMFKNAGSSLDWALEQNFGARFVRLWGDVQGRNENQQLADLLRARADVCAVSGHRLRQPLPQVEGVKMFPVFILRHPIERIYSVYSFERGQVIKTPGSTQAKRLSFRGYIQWRMDSRSPPAVRDFQTSFCSGFGDGQVPEALARALDNIRATPLVATMELYDKCLVLFESVLRDQFPGIDLSYVQQNVGRYRARKTGILRRVHFVRQFLEGVQHLPGGHDARDVNARVKRILALLGEDLAESVLANNQNDLRLYDEATALVPARLRELPDFEHRFNDFMLRCELQKKAHRGSRLRAGADFLLYLSRLVRARMWASDPDDKQGGVVNVAAVAPDHPAATLIAQLTGAGIARASVEHLISGTLSPEQWLTRSRKEMLEGTGLESVAALSRAMGSIGPGGACRSGAPMLAEKKQA